MADLSIYIGRTPGTGRARRLLRTRALDLADRFKRPTLSGAALLLQATSEDAAGTAIVELLLLRAEMALFGLVLACEGPVDMQTDGQWVDRERGEILGGPGGEPPVSWIRHARRQIIRQLDRSLGTIAGVEAGPERFGRTIGGLICAPATHPDSRITLDIDDHRQQIKILGMDELPALAAMVKTGVQIDVAALGKLIGELFEGRLWHDGSRLLFEIGLAPVCLRVLDRAAQSKERLTLLEGENVIGRRLLPLGYEYRVTLPGDDLMSNDHALLIYGDQGQILLRDTSTNGTWVAAPGASEQHLHHAERPITPGTIFRMGVTRVRLERLGM